MAEPLFTTPKHWPVVSLEPQPGSGFIESVGSGSTPSTSNDLFWDGDIPWLTPKEITSPLHGLYVSQTERNITVLGLASSAAKILPAGTVMLTKRAPVGAVVINTIPMATNQGFLNFSCGTLLFPAYLALWLRANRRYLDKVAIGSTYPELYKGDLFEFLIGIPPINVQEEIVSAIMSLEYAIRVGDALEQTAVGLIDVTRLRVETNALRDTFERIVPLLISGQMDSESLNGLQ
jgi:type I restriction enzyme S subunit